MRSKAAQGQTDKSGGVSLGVRNPWARKGRWCHWKERFRELRHQDGNNSADPYQRCRHRMHLDQKTLFAKCSQPHRRNSVKTTDVMAYARLMLMMPDRQTASSAWHRCIPPMNWKATAPRRGDAIIYIRESTSKSIEASPLAFSKNCMLQLVLSINSASPSARSSFASPSTRWIRCVIFLFFFVTQNSNHPELSQSLSISSEWVRDESARRFFDCALNYVHR